MLRVRREPPLAAKHEAYLFQLEAIEAVKDLEYAALFHEQGLGKTKIALDLVLTWLKANCVDSVLIVTKKGLIENWKQEIGAHTHFNPTILTQDRSSNFYAFNRPSRVYLTHYEAVRSERKRLALFLKTRRVGAILDEAHKIKNPDTELTKAFLELSPGFVRRVIMTGTPVANRPFDVWSQVHFLDQGAALGKDFGAFRNELELSNDLVSDKRKALQFEESLVGLSDRIRAFSVRETKATSGLELPEKTVRNVGVVLEARQQEIYDRFRDEMAAIVVREGEPLLDNAEEMLKRLLRLVQVASNPVLVDESYNAEPGKLPVLTDLLEKATGEGSKVIVWSSFTGTVDWLARHFSEFRPARIHGKLAMQDRNRAVAKFKNDPDCKLLVATPGAAKEGLTLTVANRAIFYDRSFSLDDYLQAQDRIHRISQERECVIENLIALDTVDEWVDALLTGKRLAAALGQGDISREEYTAEASYSFGEIIKEVLRLE